MNSGLVGCFYQYFKKNLMKRRERGQDRISLSICYLLKCAKRIRHKLNKLMKSSSIYNKLQHYLIEHACIYILLTLICID